MASQILPIPSQDIAPLAQPQTPTVLVVDNDSDSISHCAEMLDDLNYRHNCVTSAREALELVARDPSIQILMASMQMPSVDGFVLIEEARSRLGDSRPLAPVLLTNQVSTELALKGLHVEAVDLLCKPLDFEAYSGALRRAMRYLTARRAINDGGNMVSFGQQISQLMSLLESKSTETQADATTSDQDINATLRAIIGSRSLRNRHFPSQIFADPAWDILLDLTRAKLEDQQVSVSSVCIAASVPMSTALRWVRQMTDAALLHRWTDPKDRRRDLIALTESTASQMRDYLAAAHGIISNQ